MLVGGTTIAELLYFTECAQKCEEASYEYIRPRLFPSRYCILPIVEKLGKVTCTQLSAILNPLNVVDEARKNEDMGSFTARVLNRAIREAEGRSWVKTYQGYIFARNTGNLDEMRIDIP